MGRVRGAARAGRAASLESAGGAIVVVLAIAIGIGMTPRTSHAQAEAPSAENEMLPPAADPPPAAATPKAAVAKPPGTAATPAAPPTPSEQAWVRGEVRMNFRASASPTSTPIGVVKTGDQVGVIERRGEWARIQLGESIGWLPASYLDSQPPPREHLALLEAQVADLQQKLDAATRDADEQRKHVAQLGSTDAEREEAMKRISEENRDLRAGERWPYLVTGAGILGIGIAVGLLLRGGSRRSSYSRIRF